MATIPDERLILDALKEHLVDRFRPVAVWDELFKENELAFRLVFEVVKTHGGFLRSKRYVEVELCDDDIIVQYRRSSWLTVHCCDPESIDKIEAFITKKLKSDS